ncbi:MAG: type II toxin-antitoxin system RelE/ParE family toxin [Candidatus Hydrogenedentes bacterium]|nr:type II toxin-antitoxin system RelE/ParE family toxin [Candidatus Hydrogenedentota bacterium]
MDGQSKPLVWLHGEIKTPPFTARARVECGLLLRKLQGGEALGMPSCRPMPSIGPACFELRVRDVDKNWRIVVHTAVAAIVILEVFHKNTRATPSSIIATCRKRLSKFVEEQA